MQETIFTRKLKESEGFRVNFINVCIAILLGLLLTYDFMCSGSHQKGEVIGQVKLKIKEIKRKRGSEVLWEELDSDSDIYNYDVVKTDAFSRVTVVMDDKSEIELEENSMVIFKKGNKNVNINFVQGNLHLNTQKGSGKKNNIQVVSGETVINLDKGDVELNKGVGKEIEVNVNEGKVELENNGQKQSLQKNEVLKIQGDEIRKATKNVHLQAPTNYQYIATRNSKKTINLRWKSEKPQREHTIVLNELRSNKQKKLIRKATGESLSLELPPGKYSWKVYIDAANAEFAEARTFYLLDDTAVNPFTPEENQVFSFIQEPPRVLFSWSQKAFIDTYILEISQKPSFTSILRKQPTENQTLLLDGLPVGKYYYRIATKSPAPGAKLKYSRIVPFQITKKLQADPPELIQPSNGKQFSYDKESGLKISFVWKPQREFKNYQLQVSRTLAFQDNILNESVQGQAYNWQKNLPAGDYYWRVQGRQKDSGKQTTSAIFRFSSKQFETKQIRLNTPANNSQLEEGRISFSWEKVTNASNYVLELAKRSNFSSYVSYPSLKNSLVIANLEPGVYYWRISVPTADKTRINSKAFHRLKVLPSSLPIISFPKNSSSVDMSPRNSLTLQWLYPGRKALSYSIKLQKSNGSVVVRQNATTATSYNITDLSLLKTGNYIFSVQARLSGKDGSFLSKPVKHRFRIYLSQSIKKEKLKFKTPENVYKDVE
ncbi:MAG: FecR domain-containing protein [Spirochaetota bacterium]